MIEFKLVQKNIIGAGLKTWLKVGVLSMSYVLIIWHYGFFTGMYKQSLKATVEDEAGGGQYWHKNYDPLDPISLDESSGVLPDELENMVLSKEAVPILVRQASIYPEGRMQAVLVKGIDPDQNILKIPAMSLKTETEENVLPVLIGKRMARKNSLKIGDYITIRWRDAKGTFDAVEGKIVEIMDTEVSSIDTRHLWVPLAELQKLTGLQNKVTYIVVKQSDKVYKDFDEWKFRDIDFLLKDVKQVVQSKKISVVIMYSILVLMAMLAIFDTQILSIFRRRKEIGTLMALGMTRFRVVWLFTLEGGLIGVVAAIVAFIWGTPVIYFSARYGIKFPEILDEYGMTISLHIFPSYSISLILITMFLIMITTLIVSYLPSRKIADYKVTELLKGKIS